MNIKLLYDIAYKTQENYKVMWILLFSYILIAILLLHIVNNLYSNLLIAAFGVLAILLILWYLLSWPLYLIDEIKNPRDIPDTQHHYNNVKINPPQDKKESAMYQIEYMVDLAYSLKQRIFHTIAKILVVFMFIIFIFGSIFKAVDRLSPDGGFHGIEEDGFFLKYAYYSLITFTTVGFGDIYPKGADAWTYAATALEIATSIAYVVLSLTMAASCIFVQYSVRKEHFSSFLDTLDKIKKGKR